MKTRVYFFILVAISILIYGYCELQRPHIIAYISLDGEFHFLSEKRLIQYGPPTVIGEFCEMLQTATMSFSPVLNDETKLRILKQMDEAYTSNNPFLFYRCIPRKDECYPSFLIFLFSRQDIGKVLQVGFNGFNFSFDSDGEKRICVLGPNKNFKIVSRIMALVYAEGILTMLTYASPNEVLPLLDKGNATSDFLDFPRLPQIEEFKLGHRLHRRAIVAPND